MDGGRVAVHRRPLGIQPLCDASNALTLPPSLTDAPVDDAVTSDNADHAFRSKLLQVDGLIMAGLVELCTPHLVYALMLGSAEGHGRPEPNVEVVKIFEGLD